ncbi:putative hydrolase of the HAD superfamily [Brevinema andersonii]|uniref:Putative hydrolase of the HAD superfamily n=1 Tax=Brevinema andersonii TaxID=34097 RepID=A0A1I1EYX2_BREAD|nr:HAD family hydrolase [Brevinema andersonii]SFB91926.1 putative hydrolase of the HAD superfamily [Brevinema andersonii]
MWDKIFSLNIKGILLDLDDTLYSYAPAHQTALQTWSQSASQDLNISIEQAEKEYCIARRWFNIQLKDTGASHSRLLYFKYISEKYGLKVSKVLAWEKIYWDSFLNHMTLFPDVFPFLDKCLENKLQICLVTDLTTEIQLKKLEKLKIDHYFNYIVTSEESGQEKPKSLPFLLALYKLNLFPKDVVMIGDHQEKDILGAELLGIRSYQTQFH